MRGDVVPDKHVRVERVEPRDQVVEQGALGRTDLELELLVCLHGALQVPGVRTAVGLANDGEVREGRWVGGGSVARDGCVGDDRREEHLGRVLRVEHRLDVQRRDHERRRGRRVGERRETLFASGQRELELAPRGR